MRKNNFEKSICLEQKRISRLINVAAGRQAADLVLKNAAYVNVFTNEICSGDIAIADGWIAGIGRYTGSEEVDLTGKTVLPGLIDAHIHLESAMVSPAEFVKAVLPHGTTTVVTDPHEIANVMGGDGIEYMLQATEGLPVDVYFMLPSCVPATPIDESGAVLDYRAIELFYEHPRVKGLAEMMNYVGVLGADTNVIEKIAASHAHKKEIDGHAPGISGNALNAYVAAGIYSDHECSTLQEALCKVALGQSIMIREGTAAHNLEALVSLLTPRYVDRCMFCCDDKHPSDLLEKGHIDYNVKESIRRGVDPVSAVKAATYNAAKYFHLNRLGAIAPGYAADLIVIDDMQSFRVESTYKNGVKVFDGKVTPTFPAPAIDPQLEEHSRSTFRVPHLTAKDFCDGQPHGVIGMVSGEIVTENCGITGSLDIEKDILKIAVVERHKGTGHIGTGYIHGYGLQSGAVATSVSHDSHNIIVVGTNEDDMAAAVNHIAESGGGIVVMNGGKVKGEVRLCIAGIMSDKPLQVVNAELEKAKEEAFRLGVSREIDPFMTLSFMALPVIPTLRITTKGVINVSTQK